MLVTDVSNAATSRGIVAGIARSLAGRELASARDLAGRSRASSSTSPARRSRRRPAAAVERGRRVQRRRDRHERRSSRCSTKRPRSTTWCCSSVPPILSAAEGPELYPLVDGVVVSFDPHGDPHRDARHRTRGGHHDGRRGRRCRREPGSGAVVTGGRVEASTPRLDAEPLAAPRRRPASSYKILFVCSSGGHLSYLTRLRPWWEQRDRIWVTFDKPDARGALEGRARRSGGIIRSLATSRTCCATCGSRYRTLRTERPDVVISSGAGIGLPVHLARTADRLPHRVPGGPRPDRDRDARTRSSAIPRPSCSSSSCPSRTSCSRARRSSGRCTEPWTRRSAEHRQAAAAHVGDGRHRPSSCSTG